jgi:uncharacterized protein (TIGR02246 family)
MTASAQIEALYRDLLASWNDRDAAAWGELFTEDGSLVGFDGSPVNSPSSMTEHLEQIFADHEPAAYVPKVREIRELAPGAALLRGVAGMVPPGTSDIESDLNAIHVLVAAEVDEGWRVAHFQSTPAAFHGRPEAVEALTAELQAVLTAGDAGSATPS